MRYKNKLITKGYASNWKPNYIGYNRSFFNETFGLYDDVEITLTDQAYNRLYKGDIKFSDEMCQLGITILHHLYYHFGRPINLDGSNIIEKIYMTTFGDLSNYIDSFHDIKDYHAKHHPNEEFNKHEKHKLTELISSIFALVGKPKNNSSHFNFSTWRESETVDTLADVTIAEYTSNMIPVMGLSTNEINSEMRTIISFMVAERLCLKYQPIVQ